MSAEIYVQMPAYRDAELLPTLQNLMCTASCPERLRVAVAWQYGEEEEALERQLRALSGFGSLELLCIPAAESRGCNWARRLLQERWRGEPYTLFLDSHHRFVNGWDSLSVALYEGLRDEGVAKPVLSAYLPPYDPRTDARDQDPLLIRAHARVQGILFRLVGRKIAGWRERNTPLPAGFVSLHFLFADGRFNDEIEFDPAVYFFADEVAIALRAYTYAWDLFHPHRLLGWHLYDRSTRVTHWADHDESFVQQQLSLQRLRELFSGHVRGRHGIGECRGLASYEAMIGMPLIKLRPGHE
jgi:hypothetical protein